MQNLLITLILAALVTIGLQSSRAEDQPWVQNNRLLTGLVAGQILSHNLPPQPVYHAPAQAQVYVAPNPAPVYVAPPPAPIYVAPPPVYAPRPAYNFLGPALSIGFGYYSGSRYGRHHHHHHHKNRHKGRH